MHELCSKTAAHEQNLPLCPRAVYFTRGLGDAAILRSLLCATALHMDVWMGRRFSSQRHIHKSDAVRTIRQRLSDPESGVSDGTMTAVAILAIEEASSRHAPVRSPVIDKISNIGYHA
jgi:hypothetical protein